MNVVSRQDRILEVVRRRGGLTVAAIADDLGVGEATVRRDLRALAARGLLVRNYGGATVPEGSPGSSPDPSLPVKRAIAAAAAERVRDVRSMVVTGGTTTLEFARCLVDRTDLSVITNSLDIAHCLMDCEGIQLAVMGGVVRARSHSMLGHLTQSAATELSADVLVMGIGAISPERGLMNDHIQEVLVDRAICTMASRVVVLADSSKFDAVAPVTVVGLDGIDEIVTDDRLDDSIYERLHGTGVKLTVVPYRIE